MSDEQRGKNGEKLMAHGRNRSRERFVTVPQHRGCRERSPAVPKRRGCRARSLNAPLFGLFGEQSLQHGTVPT